MSENPTTLLCAVAHHYGHASMSSVLSLSNPGERLAFMLLAKACGLTFDQIAETIRVTPKHVEVEYTKLMREPDRRMRYETIVRMIRDNLEKLPDTSGSPALLTGGIDMIAATVADDYGITIRDLTHRASHAPLPEARSVVMHLVRELLPALTYTDLAMYFVNHEEDTFPVKVSAFRKKLSSSNLLQSKVDKLKSACTEKLKIKT